MLSLHWAWNSLYRSCMKNSTVVQWSDGWMLHDQLQLGIVCFSLHFGKSFLSQGGLSAVEPLWAPALLWPGVRVGDRNARTFEGEALEIWTCCKCSLDWTHNSFGTRNFAAVVPVARIRLCSRAIVHRLMHSSNHLDQQWHCCKIPPSSQKGLLSSPVQKERRPLLVSFDLQTRPTADFSLSCSYRLLP